MFESMESVHYGCGTPEARKTVCRVDGDLLERFLLKVLCGTSFQRQPRAGVGIDEKNGPAA